MPKRMNVLLVAASLPLALGTYCTYNFVTPNSSMPKSQVANRSEVIQSGSRRLGAVVTALSHRQGIDTDVLCVSDTAGTLSCGKISNVYAGDTTPYGAVSVSVCTKIKGITVTTDITKPNGNTQPELHKIAEAYWQQPKTELGAQVNGVPCSQILPATKAFMDKVDPGTAIEYDWVA